MRALTRFVVAGALSRRTLGIDRDVVVELHYPTEIGVAWASSDRGPSTLALGIDLMDPYRRMACARPPAPSPMRRRRANVGARGGSRRHR
jgi:hypothetical protein